MVFAHHPVGHEHSVMVAVPDDDDDDDQ